MNPYDSYVWHPSLRQGDVSEQEQLQLAEDSDRMTAEAGPSQWDKDGASWGMAWIDDDYNGMIMIMIIIWLWLCHEWDDYDFNGYLWFAIMFMINVICHNFYNDYIYWLIWWLMGWLLYHINVIDDEYANNGRLWF